MVEDGSGSFQTGVWIAVWTMTGRAAWDVLSPYGLICSVAGVAAGWTTLVVARTVYYRLRPPAPSRGLRLSTHVRQRDNPPH